MNKKFIFVFIIIAVLIAAAWAGFAVSFYSNQSTDKIISKKNNVSQTNQSTNNTNSSGDKTSPSQSQPLYLTTMTHLENDWKVDTNERFFKTITAEMRYGMALAEQYDAILTFESGLSFVEAINNFDDNVMKEALDRGFGVGTHVDLSAREELTNEEAGQIVKEHVDAVSAIVGAENNIVCSGVNGKSDWFWAARDGGCKVIDGVVGFAYLAMPIENRPNGWTDTVIIKEKFHYPAPVGDDRFYPFWINGSEDFVEDIDGDILLSSGETFSLAMYDEFGGRNGYLPACGNDCPLTLDDVAAFVEDIKDLAASRDITKIAKFNVYLPSNLFVEENETVLKKFFSEAEKLQNDGTIQWASQKEIYEVKLAERQLE